MKYVLMACLPMNVSGAAIFAPPCSFLRESLGLPESHPLYLGVLSIWILLFGVAYFWQGYRGRIDRTFLTVGAAGKAAFALLLMALAAGGNLPPQAVAVGLPDLALAVVFANWLRRPDPLLIG
ncbi:hypothetical protein [Limnoglobus roseus]|uniref:Uncharacterized protein n=1 Tax=Limnoglobus roseus TaxID=2598579 RepID=A0A5C1APT4_9BACT|nr:hypothetical protein [Limnoglobus roseus]QEL20123.1 hypothetical protein PX52LOC_07211 [Limnoglobus roseus]